MILRLRLLALFSAVPFLLGCDLDEPETVRQALDKWLVLGESTYFATSKTCTAAVYQLGSVELRPGLRKVDDARAALRLIREGQAVAIDIAGATPNQISEMLMSYDLSAGLGFLSSGVGPKKCMTDEVQQGYWVLLMSPHVVTIYDPSRDTLALVDPLRRLVLFMRGNV